VITKLKRNLKNKKKKKSQKLGPPQSSATDDIISFSRKHYQRWIKDLKLIDPHQEQTRILPLKIKSCPSYIKITRNDYHSSIKQNKKKRKIGRR
jgi:hypothetical protein